MSRRVRNLAAAAAAPLIILFVSWSLLTSEPRNEGTAISSPNVPSPTDPVAEAPVTESGSKTQRLYSIGLYRLKGLSPTAEPGTALEIWVSWSAKVSDDPKLQKLISQVVLERIEPGVAPEAPSIATLRLPVKALPNLIWGELFGQLAVATRPD